MFSCVCVCEGLRRQLWNIKITCLQLQGWTVALKALAPFYLNSPTAQAAQNTQTMVKKKKMKYFILFF